MRLSASGSSVRGPAHLLEDLPNQDALCVKGMRKGWCIAIADGLGSRKLSHIGSKKAVQLARDHARLTSEVTHDSVGMALRDAWLAYFGDRCSAYETTCLWAWVDSEGRGIAGQIGDGLLLVKSRGVFKVISNPRENFSNQTATLAQSNSSSWVSTDLEFVMPGDGVLLMSDGISDDLVPEQLELFFNAIYQRQLRSNKRRMRQWLTRELQDWSTPRHGDDKTIAGIFRTD